MQEKEAMTVKELTEWLGVSPSKLCKLTKKMGIKPCGKSPESKRHVLMYSGTDCGRLMDAVTNAAARPEGMLTIQEMADRLGVSSTSSLIKKLKKRNIEPSLVNVSFGRGRPCGLYDESVIDILRVNLPTRSPGDRKKTDAKKPPAKKTANKKQSVKKSAQIKEPAYKVDVWMWFGWQVVACPQTKAECTAVAELYNRQGLRSRITRRIK